MIHPLAHVDSKAEIHGEVEIGPFSVVMAGVRIGPGNRLISHAVVWPGTTLGSNNLLHPGVVLGGPPQDKSYRDEPTTTVIGNHNELREGVTVNRGTIKGGGVTKVGDGNLLMANCHLGHDVQLGSGAVIANGVLLAGHIEVGDRVVMGGAVACHHFVRIGRMAFIGGLSRIVHDVPPFLKTSGEPARPRALNRIGLRRNGVNDADIAELQRAFSLLFLSNAVLRRGLVEIGRPVNGLVRELVQFLNEWTESPTGRYLERLRKDRPSAAAVPAADRAAAAEE